MPCVRGTTWLEPGYLLLGVVDVLRGDLLPATGNTRFSKSSFPPLGRSSQTKRDLGSPGSIVLDFEDGLKPPEDVSSTAAQAAWLSRAEALNR